MIHCCRWLAIAAFVAVLASCANFTKQPYRSAVPIKSVLIATPADFPKADFGVDFKKAMLGLTSTTFSLSTIGGKTQALDEVLAEQGPRYHQQLLAELTRALGAAGISTQTLVIEKSKKTGLAEDYRSLPIGQDVDAILDLHVIQVGYGDSQLVEDPGIRPILSVRTRLVSAKDFQTLYADEISFGYVNPVLDAKQINAPKKYYFYDTPLVLSEKKRAAEGLHTAATEVAHFLVAQFAVSTPLRTTGESAK